MTWTFSPSVSSSLAFERFGNRPALRVGGEGPEAVFGIVDGKPGIAHAGPRDDGAGGRACGAADRLDAAVDDQPDRIGRFGAAQKGDVVGRDVQESVVHPLELADADGQRLVGAPERKHRIPALVVDGIGFRGRGEPDRAERILGAVAVLPGVELDGAPFEPELGRDAPSAVRTAFLSDAEEGRGRVARLLLQRDRAGPVEARLAVETEWIGLSGEYEIAVAESVVEGDGEGRGDRPRPAAEVDVHVLPGGRRTEHQAAFRRGRSPRHVGRERRRAVRSVAAEDEGHVAGMGEREPVFAERPITVERQVERGFRGEVVAEQAGDCSALPVGRVGVGIGSFDSLQPTCFGGGGNRGACEGRDGGERRRYARVCRFHRYSGPCQIAILRAARRLAAETFALERRASATEPRRTSSTGTTIPAAARAAP
ncbi:MAG: hypothetical protein IJ678_05705, partial [Kiritimatiellae bacterium]|nr:hypothetical protein [Kiritimatiellia bacterium]